MFPAQFSFPLSLPKGNHCPDYPKQLHLCKLYHNVSILFMSAYVYTQNGSITAYCSNTDFHCCTLLCEYTADITVCGSLVFLSSAVKIIFSCFENFFCFVAYLNESFSRVYP